MKVQSCIEPGLPEPRNATFSQTREKARQTIADLLAVRSPLLAPSIFTMLAGWGEALSGSQEIEGLLSSTDRARNNPFQQRLQEKRARSLATSVA